jgi:hypothetical protein
MGCDGLCWFVMVSVRSWWLVMGCDGLRWVVMAYDGFSWLVIVCAICACVHMCNILLETNGLGPGTFRALDPLMTLAVSAALTFRYRAKRSRRKLFPVLYLATTSAHSIEIDLKLYTVQYIYIYYIRIYKSLNIRIYIYNYIYTHFLMEFQRFISLAFWKNRMLWN